MAVRRRAVRGRGPGDCVDRLEPAGRGDYRVVLRDGTELSLSRTHRARLERLLGRRL